MKNIFIYARPCVNKMTCSVVSMKLAFFRLFFPTKFPIIEDNDENLSSIFGIELLATQTKSRSGKMSHMSHQTEY